MEPETVTKETKIGEEDNVLLPENIVIISLRKPGRGA